MKSPRYDLHMHTKYLGCANGTMEIPAMVAECRRLGVQVIGITDHLNTLDQLPLHAPIREEIAALDTDIEVYFGVELNYQACDGEYAYSAEIQEQIKKNIPLSSFGETTEIANAVLFLAGREARYITGQVLTVDGGMVM